MMACVNSFLVFFLSFYIHITLLFWRRRKKKNTKKFRKKKCWGRNRLFDGHFSISYFYCLTEIYLYENFCHYKPMDFVWGINLIVIFITFTLSFNNLIIVTLRLFKILLCCSLKMSMLNIARMYPII